MELAIKQSIWTFLGVIIALVIARFPRRQLFKYHWFFYLSGCGLLVLTLLIGIQVRGDRSWIDLGLFHVQSSEIMKPALILSLAVVSERIGRGLISRSSGLLQILLLILTPVGLIALQPDFGTAVVYLGLLVLWLFAMGLYRETLLLTLSGLAGFLGILIRVIGLGSWITKYLPTLIRTIELNDLLMWIVVFGIWVVFGILPYVYNEKVSALGIASISVSFFFTGYHLVSYLAGYQVQRIKVFLDPYKAPLQTGYTVIQSQIAIGSGGWFGKGYLEGSQSQLGFIPELWTDFIFSVAIEELGLVFGLAYIGLLLILIYSVFSTAALSEDIKGYMVCSGVASFWIVHVLINLGVCVGLLPVIGLPLPFTSYGGSFMITNWVMLGLLFCVSSGGRIGSGSMTDYS
jgi:rod shape determining protein RodA